MESDWLWRNWVSLQQVVPWDKHKNLVIRECEIEGNSNVSLQEKTWGRVAKGYRTLTQNSFQYPTKLAVKNRDKAIS